jgi:type IV pilus assembly protein PilE
MINFTAKPNALKGFTLIEVMVTLVIIAVLAAIAYPSYVKQVRKANRVVAKSALLDIANRQEHYFFSNRRYGFMDDLGYSDPAFFGAGNSPAAAADAVYAVTATAVNSGAGICGTAPCFQLQATPQNDQALDTDCGTFTLTSNNEKDPDPASSDCW